MQEDGFASSHLPAEQAHNRTESQRIRFQLLTERVRQQDVPRDLELTDDSFVAEVLDVKDRLVVFDFWSEDCVPCRFLHEAVLRLQDDMKSVKFARMNVTRNPRTVKAFELKAIPHLVAVLNGEVALEIIGNRTVEELRALIAPLVAMNAGSNGNGSNGH